MPKYLLLSLSLLACFHVYSEAQVYTLDGDSRVVRGEEGEKFKIHFVLPGVYDSIDGTRFSTSNCSTSSYTCEYHQIQPYHAEVILSGVIGSSFSRIIFSSSLKFIDIPVLIVPSGTEYEYMQIPDDTMLIRANEKENLTIFCNSSGFQDVSILLGRGGEEVDEDSVSKKKSKGLVGLEYHSSQAVEVTLKKKYPIDYVSCMYRYDGPVAVYTIDWYPKTQVVFSSASQSVVLSCLFIAGTALLTLAF